MMDVKVKFNLHPHYIRKVLLFVSLLLAIVLASSSCISVFSDVSPFCAGVSNKVVSNETELRNAIDNAVGSTTITLNNDITLLATLVISANKDITLMSNRATEFHKLIGASGVATLIVKDSGILTLDGIIVTHAIKGLYEGGCGVIVDAKDKLILYNGEISGNSGAIIFTGGTFTGGIYSEGGGVYNNGIFEMYGGKISNNESPFGFGGGVCNNGIFTMFGGEIMDNKAYYDSTMGYGGRGGVYNCGSL